MMTRFAPADRETIPWPAPNPSRRCARARVVARKRALAHPAALRPSGGKSAVVCMEVRRDLARLGETKIPSSMGATPRKRGKATRHADRNCETVERVERE